MTDTTASPTSSAFPHVARTEPADGTQSRSSNRRFLGRAWRILVGIKDGLVLILVLLFFAMIFALLTARPNAAAITDGALVLDLDGVVSEQPAPVDPFAALSGPQVKQHRAADIIRSLDAAATDERVKAVVLDLDGFMGGGQVTLARIGEAIQKSRKAGKPVLAYATGYGDDAYLLAANASEIWVNPYGGTLFAGPGGSRLYYKGLLDKLGVEAQVYRVGTFKSAVEPFIRNDQSPEAREMNQAYADALWEQWQRHVTRARPKAQIASFTADPAARVEAAGNDLTRAALSAGLVDKTGDRLTFGRRVAQIAGAKLEDRPWEFNSIKLRDYAEAHPIEETGDVIAIVPVVGTIIDGKAAAGTAGGETIANRIMDVVAEGDAKAIVLRVDSPGGSALASEQIRQALIAARAKGMPVVVSMANVAASGGYWVATASDRILAEPDTITGSIGVFGVIPTFEGSLDKLGVGTDGVITTPLSGEPDIFGGTSEQFDRIVQASVEDIYAKFTTHVARARKLPVSRVEEIAEGRVWAGGIARQIGLVDQFGGLDDAVAVAAKLAKLDDGGFHARYYEPEPDAFAEFFNQLAEDSEDEDAGAQGLIAQLAQGRQAMLAQAIGDFERMLATGGSVQAECLECKSFATANTTPSRVDLSLWSRLAALIS